MKFQKYGEALALVLLEVDRSLGVFKNTVKLWLWSTRKFPPNRVLPTQQV